MQKEWAKICRLEQRLGEATKAQEEMTNKMNDHKMKMEAAISLTTKAEEEKRQVTQQYDLKNKRGLTS